MPLLCKHCNSNKVIKKGKAKTKTSSKQVYLCKNCNKKFVETSIPNKTYPPRIIYEAISNYYFGNTLKESVFLINKKFKVTVSTSSLHNWLKEYKLLTPYSKLRPDFTKNYGVQKLITKKTFEHNGLQYNFKFHNAKLNSLCKIPKLLPLNNYITNLVNGCPDYFGKNKRCSNLKINVTTETKHFCNLACRMTSFALKAAANNKERHSLVEKFFLFNDTCTIATEIPVWFWEKSIDDGISGHIDILQVRNNKIYILDYKPNAKKDKNAIGQLFLYSRALSLRLKMKLDDFRCAWFDGDDYFEFEPAIAKYIYK